MLLISLLENNPNQPWHSFSLFFISSDIRRWGFKWYVTCSPVKCPKILNFASSGDVVPGYVWHWPWSTMMLDWCNDSATMVGCDIEWMSPLTLRDVTLPTPSPSHLGDQQHRGRQQQPSHLPRCSISCPSLMSTGEQRSMVRNKQGLPFCRPRGQHWILLCTPWLPFDCRCVHLNYLCLPGHRGTLTAISFAGMMVIRTPSSPQFTFRHSLSPPLIWPIEEVAKFLTWICKDIHIAQKHSAKTYRSLKSKKIHQRCVH